MAQVTFRPIVGGLDSFLLEKPQEVTLIVLVPGTKVEKSGCSTTPGWLVQLIRDGRSVRSRAI
jgi:hypothetical protein